MSYEKLKIKIKNSKKSKKIKILFDVTNIDEWYKKCELYILSSRYEGYPFTNRSFVIIDQELYLLIANMDPKK